MIRKLVVFVLAVLVPAAAVLVEFMTPPAVEERIEDRVAERVPEAISVAAELDSFPLVSRLLLTGRVESLTVELDDVRREIRFDVIELELEGIDIDRRALVDSSFEIDSIDSGVITAELTEEALSEVVGVPVELLPDRARATVAGQQIEVSVVVRGDTLVVDGGGRSLASVPLPTDDLFPCALEGRLLSGRARLTCTVTDVPPVLLRAVNRAVDAGG